MVVIPEELHDSIRWANGFVIIPEDAQLRVASMSYVKPSEYVLYVKPLLEKIEALLPRPTFEEYCVRG